MPIRKQLSLYLPSEAARYIEPVRAVLDPVQWRLIPAHITLCRDDELHDVDGIRARPLSDPLSPLRLRFGSPVRFGGHGWLLPCIEGQDAFRTLREHLLGSREIRDAQPHITLAHPRNPVAAGNTEGNASALPAPLEVICDEVSLIEQAHLEAPWRICESFPLTAPDAANESDDQGG